MSVSQIVALVLGLLLLVVSGMRFRDAAVLVVGGLSALFLLIVVALGPLVF